MVTLKALVTKTQSDRAAQRICRAEAAAAGVAGVAGVAAVAAVAAVAEGAEVVDQPGWAESVDRAGMELLLMLQLLRLLKLLTSYQVGLRVSPLSPSSERPMSLPKKDDDLMKTTMHPKTALQKREGFSTTTCEGDDTWCVFSQQHAHVWTLTQAQQDKSEKDRCDIEARQCRDGNAERERER